MQNELTAWLGHAADNLTGLERDRLNREAQRVNDRWPDDGEHDEERSAALSAALQFILGETSLTEARERLTAARLAEVEATAAAQVIAAMAVDEGVSEVRAAEQAGIDRMTLRRMLGKL